jgi:hypothetical protein
MIFISFDKARLCVAEGIMTNGFTINGLLTCVVPVPKYIWRPSGKKTIESDLRNAPKICFENRGGLRYQI